MGGQGKTPGRAPPAAAGGSSRDPEPPKAPGPADLGLPGVLKERRDLGDFKRGTGGRAGGVGAGWPAGAGSTAGRLAKEPGGRANCESTGAGSRWPRKLRRSGHPRLFPPPSFFSPLHVNARGSCFSQPISPLYMSFNIPVLPPP